MTTPQAVSLSDVLRRAGVTPEMLPFTNEVKRADGQHYAFSACVFAADHKPGKRPFACWSLDSRDAEQYARDAAKAELLCMALNGSLALTAAEAKPEGEVKP